jgi:ferritin-like protein
MASEGYHEAIDKLDAAVMNRHRAISSIMEELEAVDWYDQRVAATDDPELAAVLAHNRDEEKEHAAMTIEWLRRHDPVFDRHLRTYLFTEGSITEIEQDAEHGSGGGAGSGDLGIGRALGTDSNFRSDTARGE